MHSCSQRYDSIQRGAYKRSAKRNCIKCTKEKKSVNIGPSWSHTFFPEVVVGKGVSIPVLMKLAFILWHCGHFFTNKSLSSTMFLQWNLEQIFSRVLSLPKWPQAAPPWHDSRILFFSSSVLTHTIHSEVPGNWSELVAVFFPEHFL